VARGVAADMRQKRLICLLAWLDWRRAMTWLAALLPATARLGVRIGAPLFRRSFSARKCLRHRGANESEAAQRGVAWLAASVPWQ